MSKLSAEGRIALRKAITNHTGWDDYRRANSLSLASMTRDDYFRAARELGIELGSLDVPTINARAMRDTTDTAIAALNAKDATAMNSNLDQSQFPARGVATANAQAARDFADADAADDFAPDADASAAQDAPALDPDAPIVVPTLADLGAPPSVKQMAKADDILALAVDADLSLSRAWTVARNAINAATALRAKLDTTTADPRAAKLAAFTAPALDFVPPSWSRDFADFLEIGATIAIVGPAGNGKTTGARKLLERAGFTVYEFDCTDATLPQDLIGRTSLRQDNGATVTEWTAGPIAKAFADPNGAVLLNEYDALDPRTGMALQSAFEAADTRRVTSPDTGAQIHSHGRCPIVLTLNTIGHGANATYQGRNALDGANRDRIEIVTTGYEAEREIMVAHGFDAATAEKLADWATKTRDRLNHVGSREILSNRRLLTAAALMDRCAYSMADAVKRAFFCRLPDRDKAHFPEAA